MNGAVTIQDWERVLTVHQPSAWALTHGFKTVENRGHYCRVRARVLIHAGLGYDDEIAGWMRDTMGLAVPGPDVIAHGAIIGAVRICDCVNTYAGPWSSFQAGGGPGKWHWLVDDPVALDKPVPCVGKQGFWRPPPLPGDTLYKLHYE